MHAAWWEAAGKAHGERDGTRALVEVLLLNGYLPHEHLVTAILECAAAEQPVITTDFSCLELTCAGGHTWSDRRLTVSGWALAIDDEYVDVFVTASIRGIQPLRGGVRRRAGCAA